MRAPRYNGPLLLLAVLVLSVGAATTYGFLLVIDALVLSFGLSEDIAKPLKVLGVGAITGCSGWLFARAASREVERTS